MNRKIFRTIEKHLYNQQKIERAVIEARAEQIGNHGPNLGGGGGHGFISDHTAQTAIKLAMPIRTVMVPTMGTVIYPEEWVLIINNAYEAQGEKRKEILKKRYYYHNSSAIHLGIEYDMSTKSVYNLCTNFVVDVALRLASEGIIKYQ